MSWDAFWSYFAEQSSAIKKDLLKQLDLVSMMKVLPIEERRIVLKCAPKVVIDRLHDLVKEFNVKDRQTIKYSLRGFSR